MSEKGTYSDPRCCTCEPKYIWDARYACFRPAEYYRPDHPLRKNPEGWREVDGVDLPPITWAESDEQPHRTSAEAKKAFAEVALNGPVIRDFKMDEPVPHPDDPNRFGPRPYHTGRYDRAMNRIADAINKRIPAPDIYKDVADEIRQRDVLRNARSE